MAFATLALAAGGAKVLTGLAGARNRAQGMLDSGTDTLLTARSNINQRKLEAQQVQFQILESGHQAASIVQRESRKAEGSARATAGGSGAVLDNGTPQAVLTNILQEGLNAQRDVILNARQRMKSVRRDTDNQNKSEWKEAKDYMGRMRGDAKKTIANSRMQAVADIAETALNVYSAGTAGGTKAFSWGLQGAKTAQAIGSSRSAPKQPRQIGKYERNPNLRQGSRHQFKVTQGSRKASGVGSFSEPLGSGKMPVKGWRWKRRTSQGHQIRKGYGHSWQNISRGGY